MKTVGKYLFNVILRIVFIAFIIICSALIVLTTITLILLLPLSWVLAGNNGIKFILDKYYYRLFNIWQMFDEWINKKLGNESNW